MSDLETKLLDSVKKLPRASVLQVIEFAEYLSAKYSSSNIGYSQELSQKQSSHLEEEFADYRKKFPRE